jgi:hypothetical protein
MTETTDPRTLCRTCMTPIGYIDCPTGGWWAHETHPADGHDAVPGGWVDGDELMEAIAAAVWEHCTTEGTASPVVDDPRNIAGTAAAVARRLLAAPSAPADQTALRDRIAAAIRERQNPGRHWVDCEYRWRADAEADADAVLAVLPEPADRVAILREAADAVDAMNEGCSRRQPCGACDAREDAADSLRRMAGETQPQLAAYQTCGVCKSGYPTGGICGTCAFNARMAAGARQADTAGEQQ